MKNFSKSVVIVAVHKESKNSYQSGNFYGYQEFDSEKDALLFILDNKIQKIETQYENEKLGIKLIYLKTFEYGQELSRMKNLFNAGHSTYADMYWEEDERVKNLKRKSLGFIRHKKYDDMKGSDFVGNLKYSLTEQVKQYINSSIVAGYLGHSWRKLAFDKIIEKVVKKVTMTVDGVEVDKWQFIGSWLTSSDARHWMDWKEEDENLKEFEQRFKESLRGILEKGFIYSLPEHKGTYHSTLELSDAYSTRIEIK